MDGIDELSSERKRRKHDGDEDKISADRISALPDAILSQILEFLPIEQAVKTCLLSKRWRFVWTSVSKLRFIEKDIIPSHLKGKKRKSACWLDKFVEGVLRVRDSSSIREFLLFSSFGYRTLRVRSWISTAIARNVEDLNICIGGSRYIRLPPSLYTCQRLKALRLYGPFDFNVPDSACLPNLKTVCLDEIAFDDHSLNNLLSACALEELVLKRSLDCHGWMSNIRSPSLKCLFIMDWLELPDFPDCSVVIDTPALKHILLSVKGGLSKNYSLMASPSLEMADFATYSAINQNVFVNLLKSVSNVKRLGFMLFNQALLEDDELQKLPVFHNLKCLELEIDRGSWQYVQHLLDRSPNLSSMKLEFGVYCGGWKEPDHVPDCLSSHLEEVTISDFIAWSNQMEVAAYFIKNGKVIQKMIIDTKSRFNDDEPADLDPNVKVSILRQLLMLPRGSTTSQIPGPIAMQVQDRKMTKSHGSRIRNASDWRLLMGTGF